MPSTSPRSRSKTRSKSVGQVGRRRPMPRSGSKMSDETIVIDIGDAPIEVRSASERIIDVRLMPWDTIIETRSGAEMFARGAYADTPDDGLLLMGMEHEAKIGLGQN